MTSRTVRWDGFFSGCWDTYRKKINMFRSLNSKFKSYAEPESLESDLHSPPTHPKSVFLVDPGTGLAGSIKEELADSAERNANQVARGGTYSWLKAGH